MGGVLLRARSKMLNLPTLFPLFVTWNLLRARSNFHVTNKGEMVGKYSSLLRVRSKVAFIFQ